LTARRNIPAQTTASGLFGLGFGWVEIGSVTPKPQVCRVVARQAHDPHMNATGREPQATRLSSPRGLGPHQPIRLPLPRTHVVAWQATIPRPSFLVAVPPSTPRRKPREEQDVGTHRRRGLRLWRPHIRAPRRRPRHQRLEPEHAGFAWPSGPCSVGSAVGSMYDRAEVGCPQP
jgi:hypothetical protein